VQRLLPLMIQVCCSLYGRKMRTTVFDFGYPDQSKELVLAVCRGRVDTARVERVCLQLQLRAQQTVVPCCSRLYQS
jgi:hypothetical protein